MTRILLLSALATFALGTGSPAEAKDHGRKVIKVKKSHDHDHDRDREHWRGDRDRDDDHRHRSRNIYVIENHRPVQRVVYVDDRGRYYRHYGGRRVYVTGRYFTSYPSRYFYTDGRPRIGVSINF